MRILIAEDDTVSRKALKLRLKKWGYDVIATSDGRQAWDHLKGEESPLLAILDWMMPEMDGIEVCRRVRRERPPEAPYIYLLLLTARGRKEDIIEGLNAGADDYLVKPFDPHELQVRLRAGRRILNLLAELTAAREALREKALHDPLTGLWNRAAIMDILRNELDRAAREGSPISVSMADIDHFKRINDTYGHMAGDVVLCEVARRIVASVRSYDSVARYGGEEFLFIMPGSDSKAGRSIAERIRENIARDPVDAPEGLIPVTISVGVATARADYRTTPEEIIKAADAALYRAKNGGRNRTETTCLGESDTCPEDALHKLLGAG